MANLSNLQSCRQGLHRALHREHAAIDGARAARDRGDVRHRLLLPQGLGVQLTDAPR